MSDETDFSPEFNETIKNIVGGFKGMSISLENPLIDLPNPTDFIRQNDLMKELKPVHNPTYDLIEKQEEANELLNKIVENTSVLKELVEINRETQLNTEELNYVMRAIYEVAKADNKKEADTLFTKALKAINDSGEAAGNVASLTSVLMGIYTTVNTMI